ncbi:hypothetical protein EV650_2697 [Kribbella kalugense]|uniref:Uncharacterized protein n=1 Tax=Kribbella kalugense TaxID=2512221 RepID=A0A4R8A021_9ACTN|nr:hypothetical protein EV650_2697 [Kribbella kalugense]
MSAIAIRLPSRRMPRHMPRDRARPDPDRQRNAESNNHLITINEQLNYKIIARILAYQKKL